jgi:hypothetical protein
LPAPDLCVALTAGVDAHKITVSAQSALGESWLARV